MRTLFIPVILAILFGATTANAQANKQTGLFQPPQDSPVVMRIDDKRSLHITDKGQEEWIFCIFKTEFEDRLDGVIILKTEKTEYANRCPIMLIISDRVGEKNSINFTIGVGEVQQNVRIPILYIGKEEKMTRRWLRNEYRRMVLNQEEEVSYY